MKKPRSAPLDLVKLIENGQLNEVVGQLKSFSVLEGPQRRSFCERNQKGLSGALLAAARRGRHQLLPLLLPFVKEGKRAALMAAVVHNQPLVVRALIDEVDDRARSDALHKGVSLIYNLSRSKENKSRREDAMLCIHQLLEKGARPIMPSVIKQLSVQYYDEEIFAVIACSKNFNDADVHAAFLEVVKCQNASALGILIEIHRPPSLPPKLLARALENYKIWVDGEMSCVQMLLPLCDHLRAAELADHRVLVPRMIDRATEFLSIEACRHLYQKGYKASSALCALMDADQLNRRTARAPLKSGARRL